MRVLFPDPVMPRMAITVSEFVSLLDCQESLHCCHKKSKDWVVITHQDLEHGWFPSLDRAIVPWTAILSMSGLEV